jgi:Fur family ferric uptake transcriptional regulator
MGSSPHANWSEHANATLDAAGHNRGAARSAIIQLLANEPCAISAQDMEDRLRARSRPVSRASIYRVLDLLGSHRLIQRLDVGQGSALYELIDPAGDHHHHLLCQRCGRVVPFDDPRLEQAIEGVSGRLDFRVEHHEVVLRGACGGCRER